MWRAKAPPTRWGPASRPVPLKSFRRQQRRKPPSHRRSPAGPGGCFTSRFPAAGARSSSGAFPSRRRCCPRGGIVQGLVWGITAAIGYGLGVLAAWIWRAFADRDPRRPRRRAWPAFFISAAVLLVVSFGLGQYWQYEIRRLMGVTDYNIPLVIASPFVAARTFCLLLLIGRGLRGLYRSAAQLLNRWIGPRAAHAVGWILVAGLTYLVVTGLLLEGLSTSQQRLLGARHHDRRGSTPADDQPAFGRPGLAGAVGHPGLPGPQVHRPRPVGGRHREVHRPAGRGADPGLRRAGVRPRRRVPGRPGGQGPRACGRLRAQEPARGDHDRQRLGRPGAGGHLRVPHRRRLRRPSRSSTPTCRRGSPTWSTSPRPARRAARCSTRSTTPGRSCPPDQRPRLFVAGESLGSFGGETAFSGEYDLRNRTGGTLFAGPPNFNTLFREFSDHRDPGSPEIQPVYKDGRTVRFANDPGAAIPPDGQPWEGSRVLYLMHPSDPIVWWSPNLIFSKPDWISEPPGKDVLKGMVWMPFVTFWQVTADLPFSTGVPAGHGHKYTAEYVDGWNAVIQPAGITPQDRTELRKIIAGEE